MFSLSLSLYLCRRMSPSSNYLEWCARASFEEKFLLKNGSLSTKQHKGFWEKHFTSLLFFAAFEKRVRANKESSSYIIYIEATGTIRGRERERERDSERRASWHHHLALLLLLRERYIRASPRNRSERERDIKEYIGSYNT